MQDESSFSESFPHLGGVEYRPPKSAHSRWCSFQQSWAFSDPYVGVDNLLLAFTCIKKDWASTLDDLLPEAKRPVLMAPLLAGPGSSDSTCADGSVASSGGAASSSGSADASAVVVPAKAPKAKAKPTAENNSYKAKAQVNNDRRASRNTLHCVAKYKADADFVNRARRLVLRSSPEVRHHGWLTSQVHTEEETMAFFC